MHYNKKFDNVKGNYAMAKTEVKNLEIRLAGLIFIIGLLLRIVYIFQYHFDTDEPQHLHVVWAWTRGLLQYRDVFDNHSPLFHILCAPILYIVGERATALFFMRLAMVPLFLIAMFCTYIIGRNLFSKRIGVWTAVLISIYPAFFFCSLQFRADVLWMVFWLAGLSVILGRALTLKRLFWAGLLFGLAVCASLKTILLLLSLIIALILSALSGIKHSKNIHWRRMIMLGMSALSGFLLMPIIIIAFFASRNALNSLFYCTISHNILPDMGHWGEGWRIILFLILLPVLFRINKKFVYPIKRHAHDTDRSVMFLCVIVYFLSLFSFWPVVTRQNFLPVYSLIAFLFVPKILEWIDRSRFSPDKFLIFVSAFEIIVILFIAHPWVNQTKETVNNLSEVIKLTDRDDRVIDQKGETIFRPRLYYYILETFTRQRFLRGLIPDNIIEQLINKRCCVSTNEISRFPPDTRKFLWENYVSVGYLRVAGKMLEPSTEKRHIFKFNVRIPASYVIAGKDRAIKGVLDNSPYTGARFLEAGDHEFISDTDVNEIALIWAKASKRGFSPF